jgi:hypothetical protein
VFRLRTTPRVSRSSAYLVVKRGISGLAMTPMHALIYYRVGNMKIDLERRARRCPQQTTEFDITDQEPAHVHDVPYFLFPLSLKLKVSLRTDHSESQPQTASVIVTMFLVSSIKQTILVACFFSSCEFWDACLTGKYRQLDWKIISGSTGCKINYRSTHWS